MYDRFNRSITYLRVSVTDRCNLRCIYCMPEEGVKLLAHPEILSYEEIFDVISTGVSLGIDKVRITGGEPLVRKGIISFVGRIAGISGIKDLSLTTNGILLVEFARSLADAGLKRINISLDTVNPQKYIQITRRGKLDDVLNGIEAAVKAGLQPVKINCVVRESSQEKDARGVAEFCRTNGLEVRFIRRMYLGNGEFSKVEGGSGGDCAQCNRLRLTADGMIKPCLFNDIGFSVRQLGAYEAIREAVYYKPSGGTRNMHSNFYNIGG